MEIGEIIRNRRLEMKLTQEEMASRLGVTAPAVNKWEKGNTKPDIDMLSPLARLLDLSLDELLSFRATLTEKEVRDYTERLGSLIESSDYASAFEWARSIVARYPNCNSLIISFATILDASREDGSRIYDDELLSWYNRALEDKSEEIRYRAAISLFHFYMERENYEEARKCLEHFPSQDPMKKINEGRLLEEEGKTEDARKSYEETLFSLYSAVNMAFSFLSLSYLKAKDYEKAEYMARKAGDAARLFDMGRYQEVCQMLEVVTERKDRERTLEKAREMLESVDTLTSFRLSPLYSHLSFSEPEKQYFESVRESLLECFRDEETFGYMKGLEEWERIVEENH